MGAKIKEGKKQNNDIDKYKTDKKISFSSMFGLEC